MANGNFGGGNGTVGSPYLIEDFADFSKIRDHKSANFKQVNDITCPYEGMRSLFYNSAGVDTGAFTGVYDGSNYTLFDFKTITIYDYDAGFVSYEKKTLFGSWVGEIKDLKIEYVRCTYGELDTSTFGGLFHTVNAVNVHAKNINVSIYHDGFLKVGGFCYDGSTRFCSIDIEMGSRQGGYIPYNKDNVLYGLAGYSWTGTHSDIECYVEIYSTVDVFAFGGENLTLERCCVLGGMVNLTNSQDYKSDIYPYPFLDNSDSRASGFVGSSMPGSIIDCFTLLRMLSNEGGSTFGFSAKSYTSEVGVTGLIKNCWTKPHLIQSSNFVENSPLNRSQMYGFTMGSPGKNHCIIDGCIVVTGVASRTYLGDNSSDYVSHAFHKDIPSNNLKNCYSYPGQTMFTTGTYNSEMAAVFPNRPSVNVRNLTVSQTTSKAFYSDIGWDMESVWFLSPGYGYAYAPLLIYRSPNQEWGEPGTHFMNYIYVLPHVGGSASYMDARWKYQFSFHTYPMPFAQGRTGDEVIYEVGNLHHRIYDPYQEKEVDAVFIFSGIRDFKGPGGFAYYSDELKRTTFVKDNMAATVNFYFTDASLLPASAIRKVNVSTPNGIEELLVFVSEEYPTPLRFCDVDGTVCCIPSFPLAELPDPIPPEYMAEFTNVRVMTDEGPMITARFFDFEGGIEMFSDDSPPVGGA